MTNFYAVPIIEGRKPRTVRDFRRVGTAVLAADSFGQSQARRKKTTVPDAAQNGKKADLDPGAVLTRLTGRIFESHEIPQCLHSVIAKPVAAYDSAHEMIDAYKPLFERIIYWETIVGATWIIIGVCGAWLIGWLGGGIGTVFILGIVVGGVFRREGGRVRRRVRDEVVREMGMKKLETDTEAVEWLNLFLTHFWEIFEPDLSQQIKTIADGILDASKPGFLEDLRLAKFTLGSQAPRVEGVRSWPGSTDDVLVMDWEVSFTPLDAEQVSQKKSLNQDARTSKIELLAKVGKGVASIPVSVLVTDMEFRGKARVRISFISSFPYIGKVDLQLLKLPYVDFVVRPLKALDLMDTPGLSQFINDQINYNVSSMLIDPHWLTLDIAALMGVSSEADKPVGVLRILIFEARDLKNRELTGKSDPYCVVTIGGKQVVKTRVIGNTLAPSWDEKHYVVLTKATFDNADQRADELKVEVLDHNNVSKHKTMGTTGPLRLARWVKLLQDEEDESAENPLTPDERERLIHEWSSPFASDAMGDIWKRLNVEGSLKGDIRLALAYFPSAEVPLADAPAINSGVVRFTIHQAKELSFNRSAGIECSYEDKRTKFTTRAIKKTRNPVWGETFLAVVEEVADTKWRFIVGGPGVDGGVCDVAAQDIIGQENPEEWFKLVHPRDGSTVGRLRVTFQFTPIDLVHQSTDPTKAVHREPIAYVRLHVIAANNLANVEMVGKSDPYCRVSIAGNEVGRTRVKENTLKPKWGETFGGVVWGWRDTLSIDIYDWNGVRKDRPLGACDFLLEELMGATTGEEPYSEFYLRSEADGLKVTRDGLAADVWAPLYQNKRPGHPRTSLEGTEDTASHGSSHGHSAKDVQRMKGEIQFRVEVLPVMESYVIRPLKRSELATPLVVTDSVAGTSAAATSVKPEDGVDGTSTAPASTGEIEQNKQLEERVEADVRRAHTLRNAGEEGRAEFLDRVFATYPSGILRLRVHMGDGFAMPINAYVEVLLDGDVAWRTSTKKKSQSAIWGQSMDQYVPRLRTRGFVIRLRHQLNKEPQADDPLVGEWTGDVVQALVGRRDEPVILTSNGQVVGRLRVSCGWSPVEDLEGGDVMVWCDIVQANNIMAADRGGTSDPFCAVSYNGHKLHKTKVIKKTVNPQWKESFSTAVSPREAGIEFTIKDWNPVRRDVELGKVKVDVSVLEHGRVYLQEYPLGSDKGTLTLRLLTEKGGTLRTSRSSASLSSSRRGSLTSDGRKGITSIGKFMGKALGRSSSREEELSSLSGMTVEEIAALRDYTSNPSAGAPMPTILEPSSATSASARSRSPSPSRRPSCSLDSGSLRGLRAMAIRPAFMRRSREGLKDMVGGDSRE
ncbi:hypothetical protein BC832DRAFT_555623 [Gaertneriomyces semiglobifer]|nr:hypothetical protein BC832DRAFT_555623 [Gaertneriomyces semiglobifer]